VTILIFFDVMEGRGLSRISDGDHGIHTIQLWYSLSFSFVEGDQLWLVTELMDR
jgi:hypothetical protein